MKEIWESKKGQSRRNR